MINFFYMQQGLEEKIDYSFAIFEYCPVHMNEMPILLTFFVLGENSSDAPHKLH